MIAILNWIPVFHLSCDDFFGAYKKGSKRRFSLVVISLGRCKIYIISLSENKFSIFKILRFDVICHDMPQADIDQAADAFSKNVNGQNDSELSIQYEFLKERFNTNENSKSSLETRVSAHITTYLALLGVYGYILTLLLRESGRLAEISWGILAFGCVFLVAAATFMWPLLQVKGVTRSTFSELRTKPTLLTQARLAYINWYASQDEIHIRSSQAKNAELNIILALFISIPLWIFVQFFVVQTDVSLASRLAPDELPQQVVSADGSIRPSALRSIIEIDTSTESVVLTAISAPRENPSRDRVVGLLRSIYGETRVEDLRIHSDQFVDKRTIITVRKQK